MNPLPWRCRIRRHDVAYKVMEIEGGQKRLLVNCSCGKRWRGTPVVHSLTRYRWVMRP